MTVIGKSSGQVDAAELGVHKAEGDETTEVRPFRRAFDQYIPRFHHRRFLLARTCLYICIPAANERSMD